MCRCGSGRDDLILWVSSGVRLSECVDGVSKYGDVEEEEDGLCEGVEEEPDRPTGFRDDTLTTAGGVGHGPMDSEDNDLPSTESVELVSSPEVFDDPERSEAQWV